MRSTFAARAAGILWVTCALLLFAAPVQAADIGPRKGKKSDVSKEDRIAAIALLKEGDAHFLEGNMEEALEHYQEAHELYPSSGALRRIGEAYVALRRYAPAKEAFEEYLKTGPKKGPRRAAVEEHISELEIILSTRLVVTSDPEGATVYIDSKADGPVGVTPLETYLVPGPHRLILEARYHEKYEADIDAIAGEGTDHAASMVPRPAALRVTSEPPMAVVLVDGVRAGRTPVTTIVEPGDHAVKVTREGWMPFEAVISAAGEPVELEATLERPPRAPTPVAPAEPDVPEEPEPSAAKKVRVRTKHSHGGKLLLTLSYRDEILTRLDAGVFEIGYGISDLFEIKAGALLGTFGGRLRLRAFPVGRKGPYKLAVALEVPLFRVPDEGLVLAAGGTVGFQWDVDKHFGFYIEAGANYGILRPDGFRPVYVVGAGGAQLRLP